MTQLTSLLWKEWREARPYLLIGLGLFLGMPLIGGVERQFQAHRPFEIVAAPWVVYLGGVLAVFVAVGVTTADLRPRVDDFWRSRPIRVRPWLATKYAVGLAVVLAVCELPLAVERAVDARPDVSATALLYFPFFWAAAFSLAFLAACVVARPAQAATLGLAALLLAYTVPVTVPPLSWLNVADAVDPPFPGGQLQPRQLAFAGGMVAVAAVAAVMGVIAVRRGWRVESGRRLMFGSVAAAFLLLFTSAAFQLGSNLPVLQRVDLPADQQIELLAMIGSDRGYMVTRDPFDPHPSDGRSTPQPIHYWYRPFTVGPTGIGLGAPTRYRDNETRIPWPNSGCLIRGDTAYRIEFESPLGRDDVIQARLDTINVPAGTGTLTPPLWEQRSSSSTGATLYLWQDRLYVIGRHLIVFDVSRPGQPRLVSDDPTELAPPPSTFSYVYGDWADHEQVRLLPLPGLPPQQRLEATLRATEFAWRPAFDFDGSRLCRTDDGLSLYRLTHQDAETATFDRVGQARPTPLQRWASPYKYQSPMLRDGLVYVGSYGWGETFGGSVTIFDTRGPRPMRRVGHFAAPGAWLSQPLDDGRAIVAGGNRLWLVGAPKRS